MAYRIQHLDHAIGIPDQSSLNLKNDLNAPVAELNTIGDAIQPPVVVVFRTVQVMVGPWMLMLLLGVVSLWARWRGRLYEWPLLPRSALVMAPMGFVVVIAG